VRRVYASFSATIRHDTEVSITPSQRWLTSAKAVLRLKKTVRAGRGARSEV
jgi:hypothetical protein